ncbi:hypothetical protein ACFLRO_01985 [Bacteroidota bacterium]
MIITLRHIALSTCAIGLLLLAFADCSAQMRVPNLGGHRFIPSESNGDPFVNTHVVSQVGIGSATNLEFPLFEFNGDTLFAPRGNLLLAVLRFDYQQRIKKWLGVRASFSTVGRLGTDAGSLLAAGVTASTDLRFEWLVNVMQNDRSALSAIVGYRNATATVVDVFSFVEDVIDGEDAKLVDSIPSVQVLGGVRYAYGFSSLFGIKLSGIILYGDKRQVRVSEPEVNYEFGLSLSLDPREKLGFPIGVLASYSLRTLTIGKDEGDSDSMQLELKFDYTKPNDFSIGPAITWSRSPGLYQTSITILQVAISSRYYF